MRHNVQSIDTIIHPGSSYATILARRATAVLEIVLNWQQRARERHALAAMDEHALKDIGLTRADILAESTKPFWRA